MKQYQLGDRVIALAADSGSDPIECGLARVVPPMSGGQPILAVRGEVLP